MKREIVIILIISLAMIISCTGCENEIGGTTDLTANEEILISHRWVKDLDGEGDSYLAFDAHTFVENKAYSMCIYKEEGAFQSTMGLIQRNEDQSVTAKFDDKSYDVKISSTQSGVITLSLTDQTDSSSILYFSPLIVAQ